ncbi:heterokaryon incompatibility protein-domain-containing protein [Cercophora scortea]|uniref:Heterokaryon incompatibility protein-domain-containing protein n=1 Tax=Cercophora scortea TaxID=314031 RepID=A0AAE0M7F3_9PEZI|nr:heterokaryon incompatibility protein-domain-containing protein [Cercophora scortea]
MEGEQDHPISLSPSADTKQSIPPLVYTPLDPTRLATRLFELFPGSRDDVLSGSLRTVDLKTNPDYDAVSYVWGDPRPCFDLVIDGQLLQIGESLGKALIAMRQHYESRILWVDAICINQQDVAERGHQVRLMANIFSAAQTVRVWLDVHVDLESPAIQATQRLKLWTGKDLAKLFPRDSRWHAARQPDILIRDRSREFWDPLYRIFEAPYWERVWTQQELFRARNLEFHFPTGVLGPGPLLVFEEAACHAHLDSQGHRDNANQARTAPYFPRRYGCALFSSLYTGFVVGRRGAKKDHHDRPMLLPLFLKTAHLKTKDPRDRVFGILGLAHDCRGRNAITADYGCTLVETYSKVAIHYFQTHASLDFLCYEDSSRLWHVHACHATCSHEPSLPTWLPSPEKYSQLMTGSPLAAARHATGTGINTIRNLNIKIRDHVSLFVRGVHCDTLTAVVPEERIVETTSILKWRGALERAYNLQRNGTSTPSTGTTWTDPSFYLLLEYWAPVIKEWTASCGKPNPTTHEFAQMIMHFLLTVEQGGSPILTLDDFSVKAQLFSWNIPDHAEVDIHTAQVLASCLIGSVFVYTQRRRLGTMQLCNQVCPGRPGDEVWVLFGCSMPMILRPKRTGEAMGYWVIGPADIPGLMNGEACQGLEPDGSPGPEYEGSEPVEIELI